jgi:hypothetical protein
VQYRIPSKNIYNFNKTRFIIGVALTSKVVTSSDTVGQATVVQPGNREWVTTIKCINALGWSILPMVILSGKLHQASWYQNLLPDCQWIIAVSDNRWTTDQLGLTWLEHFYTHTEARLTGAYRLLILNSHSSHATPKFN